MNEFRERAVQLLNKFAPVGTGGVAPTDELVDCLIKAAIIQFARTRVTVEGNKITYFNEDGSVLDEFTAIASFTERGIT